MKKNIPILVITMVLSRTTQYNVDLSVRRAKNVKTILEKAGAEFSRLFIISEGADTSIALHS